MNLQRARYKVIVSSRFVDVQAANVIAGSGPPVGRDGRRGVVGPLDRRVPNRHFDVWSQPVLLLWVLDLAVRGADTAVWLTLLLPWAYASGAVIGRPSLSDLRAGSNSTSLRFWPTCSRSWGWFGRSNARPGTH